jgi:hypothetical protein
MQRFVISGSFENTIEYMMLQSVKSDKYLVHISDDSVILSAIELRIFCLSKVFVYHKK